MQLKDSNKNSLTLFVLFSLCVVVNAVLYVVLGGYFGGDLQGHWSISAYTLRGYNPYPLIGVEGGPIPEIWDIPKNFSTVPWGCLLGSVFYAGFMPMKWAYVYNFVMHFVFLILAALVIYKTFKPYIAEKTALWFALLLLCAHFSFMYSIYYGNAGGIICPMLIMSIYLAKERPYTAGVLLALAMSKPQIAAIVCVVFLLEGRWKTLFSAAAIDILAWLAVSVITATSPLELLMQTFSSGTASDVQYLGLFSVLRHTGIPKGAVLGINVIVGLVYTVGLWYYLKKKSIPDSRSLVLYVPSCVASVFWIYKNGTDYMVLVLAIIFFCVLYLKNNLTLKDRILSILCIGFMQMSRCAVYLGIVLTNHNPVRSDLVKSLDGLILAITGIIFCSLWVKYNKKEN